ncbi:hypothetical protein EJ08DRAFT_699261 [Tothia fuscella]|uniref:Uncharacterized protein n=1 Tax=Tothia fuscella TaxID=1048955 RepID=A0A9P4NMW6_9PEZI|nr:hypothetical protein EJ08DRAFT_699261 [Tothia fuscella]
MHYLKAILTLAIASHTLAAPAPTLPPFSSLEELAQLLPLPCDPDTTCKIPPPPKGLIVPGFAMDISGAIGGEVGVVRRAEKGGKDKGIVDALACLITLYYCFNDLPF